MTQRGMKEWADKTDIKDINCLLLVWSIETFCLNNLPDVLDYVVCTDAMHNSKLSNKLKVISLGA